jgi:N-methylhydantoinase A
MEADAVAMLDAANVPQERRAIIRQADLRYRRQAYELTVPLIDGRINRLVTEALAEAFHAKHAQTYGHANRAEPVQLVNLRVTALGRLPALTLAQRADPDSARLRERDVWFAGAGFIATPVHWRPGLLPGTLLSGPAIIEALDSTTVVPPGWAARFDEFGCIRLARR